MKSFLKHSSFIIFYFILCHLIPSIILFKYGIENQFVSLSFALGGLLCVILSWLMYHKDIKSLVKPFFTSFAKNILIIFTLWIIMLLVTTIISVSTGNNETNNQAEVIELTKHMSTPVLFVTLSIIFPWVEEIIFRHILINKLSHVIPTALAATISCALFAGVHAGSHLIDFIIYLPMSLSFTCAYLFMKGRLLNSFTLHLFQNTLASIAILFQLR